MAGLPKQERVVVLGASPKPNRYAFKAFQMLRDHGHEALPVNPAYEQILDVRCYRAITEVPAPVDTVTLYLGKRRSDPLIEQILSVAPGRLILNPGAENENLGAAARAKNIEVVEGCTLVMLTIGTF